MSQLGISDCYVSPLLKPAKNSTHGYDICNHSRLNPALGDQRQFESLIRKLRSNKLGLIIDFVPNHMSTDPECNQWWRSVLLSGPSSPYARFFDIDWDPLKDELKNKVLLPILGGTYGDTLQNNELRVIASEEPSLQYYETNLPLQMREKKVPENVLKLHQLLESQHYRLSYWRTALHEINYRRFFDVNSLVGLRVEDPVVFDAVHEFLISLIHQEGISGIRLDHVDGLFDPAAYLNQLVEEVGDKQLYIVVEKILSNDESLPHNWSIHGTTGYDFLNSLNGLFVDGRNAQKMKRNYERFAGIRELFSDVIYQSKKLIIQSTLASELNVLAHELNRISETNWEYRDFTLDSLQEAVCEIVACFPVYRTYVSDRGWTSFDEHQIDIAVARALRRNPIAEPTIFAYIRKMLLPERKPQISEEEYQRRLRFAMKFQQYTGPVHAKGVEDTAFYRYAPLLSLNEVGGDPLNFGRTIEEFHQKNEERLSKWPYSMTATSTHDTKRGEDARARLNVLSEIPDEFRFRVIQWARVNAGKRTMVDGKPAPDRRDEYFFYQALIGSWPAADFYTPDREYIERLQAYMSKMTREGKRHTSWINPNVQYDSAVEEFVRKTLLDQRFLGAFSSFASRVALRGMVNSLAQLVLKIASPGIPDFYQGTELWDLNLVDPDNRRPVDFKLRRSFMNELLPLIEHPEACAVQELFQRWQDGKIKQYITACGLRLRRSCPDVLVRGEYIPLEVRGEKKDHLIAFLRQSGGQKVFVAVPRLAGTLNSEWQDTHLIWPYPETEFVNAFTGEKISFHTEFAVTELFQTLPVGMWSSGIQI